MAERPLIEKARALLHSGRIPPRRPDRVLAGPGSSRDRCMVCEEAIPEDQVVWEAEFDEPAGTTCHSFHVHCFQLVELHIRREDGEFDRDPGTGRRTG